MRPIADAVLLYFHGELGKEETLAMFKHLIDTGEIWSYPSSMVLDASRLILSGAFGEKTYAL